MECRSLKLYNQEDVKKYLTDLKVVFAEDTKEVESLAEVKADNKKLQLGSCSCSYCNLTFKNVTDQRVHFKLDWHRYNLKQALHSLPSVTEDKFDTLADDVSSISGSESEFSGSESEDEDENSKIRTEDIPTYKRQSKIIFSTKDERLISIYKCLVEPKKGVKSADNLQIDKLVSENELRWMVLMIGGGHFAAAIFKNSKPIIHKTFHKYTVRAQQGGTQSSNDNRKGGAKSAGASLRRYNERSLAEHVQEILSTWTSEIKSCQFIFCRAAGPTNKRVIFGGKNSPLDKNDDRIRSIPFPTRRATFNELKRVFDMLATADMFGSFEDFRSKKNKTRDKLVRREPSPKSPKKHDRGKERKEVDRSIPGLKIGSSSESDFDVLLTEDFIQLDTSGLKEYEDTVPQWVKDAKKENRKRKKKTGKKKTQETKDKLQEDKKGFQSKLVLSCKNNDRELLTSLLEIVEVSKSYGENVDKENTGTEPRLTHEDYLECLNGAINEDTKDTVLHLAASKCLPEFVTLLLEAGSDPAVKNKKNLPAYSLSGDKDTKTAFKLFVSLYPDKYDFKKAQIPEPLTEEQEREQEEKKKEKRKNKKEKEKIKKKINAETKAENVERERFLALSDREKCALAAERRLVASSTSNMKTAPAPVLSRCFQCAVDITGRVPFQYDVHRFCSVPCLQAHRAKTNSYGVEI